MIKHSEPSEREARTTCERQGQKNCAMDQTPSADPVDKKQQKNEEKSRGKEAKQRRKSIFLTRSVSVFSQNCLSLPHKKSVKRANTLPADMEFKPYMRKTERKSFKKSVSKFLSFVHAS